MLFKTVLFDLDGTITDPGIGITNSVAYSLRHYGINPPAREELYPFIGPPLKDSYMKYYGFSEEKATEAVEIYREYFRDKGIFENEVYEGVPEMLDTLRANGAYIILATSKPEEFAVRILKHFNLYDKFDFVCGNTMDEKRARKDLVIRYAIDSCNITDLYHTVMVGDRCYDILGGKDNGLKTIGVLYGYGSREELAESGADYLAESPEDVLRLVKKGFPLSEGK